MNSAPRRDRGPTGPQPGDPRDQTGSISTVATSTPLPLGQLRLGSQRHLAAALLGRRKPPTPRSLPCSAPRTSRSTCACAPPPVGNSPGSERRSRRTSPTATAIPPARHRAGSIPGPRSTCNSATIFPRLPTVAARHADRTQRTQRLQRRPALSQQPDRRHRLRPGKRQPLRAPTQPGVAEELVAQAAQPRLGADVLLQDLVVLEIGRRAAPRVRYSSRLARLSKSLLHQHSVQQQLAHERSDWRRVCYE